ncbi:uncharacterized protein HD556DRAFT_1308298 [Suillus plorans]|uniref:Uncharacterized protein n=1 Tax=Suillus plorans TaxID=116603 RepID=A0A9P7DIK6_9AGAM|nr:uncharacterized protein HD556DRAFT_1308298 [Suillus plorans]KAG1794249.1 hypothetical protein HD556DRAFT_1308298 [Suillus plorans]
MAPHAINSPKKKRSKHKGSDASGRAAYHLFLLALLKLKMVLYNVPAAPIQGKEASEPARKEQKGHSKVRHVVSLPYSSLTITNGPASIDNTGSGFSIYQPGGSLYEANNSHIAIGLKAVKKHAMKVAHDPNPHNIVLPLTTFMEQNLDLALFEENNNVSRSKGSSTNNSNDEDEDEHTNENEY